MSARTQNFLMSRILINGWRMPFVCLSLLVSVMKATGSAALSLSASLCSDAKIAGHINKATKPEPSFAEKIVRRVRVYKLAARVFVDIKRSQRKEKRLRRKLGIKSNDGEHPAITELWDKVHERNAALLTRKIKSLEGFWIKVGQYLSSRADVMPPAYLRELSALQDSMPAKKFEDVWQTLVDELGEEGMTQFESIDPEPLSTASLAQVHRARLVGGREVVVKVQHRGVASLMLQDMDNLRSILNVIAYLDPDIDFGPVIREYSSEVRKELDFRVEAQNMEEVRTLLRETNIRAIVPRSVDSLVRKRVLVMDYCHGFPVRDVEALDRHGVDRHLLLSRICGAWAAQMHVGGVFNADPHAGNILVSTNQDDGDASVPVLLDFGLTKRLDNEMKTAFALLMHSSDEMDVDGLLQSFESMGLKLNRYDPFEDMAAMQRSFGETVPQKEAKEALEAKKKNYQKRMQAMKEDQGIEAGQKLRSPVDAWPAELVFFGRVTNMLRGLCSRLDVRYPYLRTMASAARLTLHETVPSEERAVDFIHPAAEHVDTPLQRRLIEEIRLLHEEGDAIGLQICVISQGTQVANIASGVLGTANPRPVTPTTLFCIFSVSKAILTLGMLRLMEEGKINLDDPVAMYWPEFATQDKDSISIRHVLAHQAGLSNAMPDDVTLESLLDWSLMKEAMESAVPEHGPGEETQYHYLTYAWICGGIIESVTGRPYEDFLLDIVIKPLQLEDEVFMGGVPGHVSSERLAVLTVEKRQSRDNESVSNETKSKQSDSGKQALAKYKGREQLLNPSIFNMRKVREAKLPSANGHSSAAALAAIFSSLITHRDRQGSLLSSDTLEKARTRQVASAAISGSRPEQQLLDDSGASFGLGLQVHDFRDTDGKIVQSMGHAGLGGSVVIALPEMGLSIAFVTNLISRNSKARRRILSAIFEEFGLHAPSSMGLH